MKSSSFHFLSGDRRLSAVERLLYRGSYVAEQLVSALRSSAIPIEIYRPRLDQTSYVELFGEEVLDASPDRVLCYDFIACHGASVFGPARAVIDLGCGRGNYSRHLRRAFGYRRYLGCDIAPRPEWESLARPDTTFAVKELGVDLIDVTDFDTVFSQSVLEHVANDAAVFRRFVTRQPRRLRHLHLIPALASYQSYRFHGYRRYSPHQLDRLTSAPGIRAVRAFAFGNQLTRDMHHDHSRLARRTGKRRSPLDGAKPMFDNLAANRARIDPSTVREADFFALIFDQDVG